MKIRPEFLLSLVLLVLTGIGLFLWRQTGDLHDFGLNFTSEMLGALITVFVVDILIRQRDAQQRLPYRLVAYQEMSALLNQFLELIFSLYEQSVGEPAPPTVEGFIQQRCPTRCLYSCDLNRLPRVTPPQSLADYLASSSFKLQETSIRVIERFSLFTEPKPIRLIHLIFQDSAFLPSLRQLAGSPVPAEVVTAEGGEGEGLVPGVALATRIFVPNEEFWNRVLALYTWLDEERTRLSAEEEDLRALTTPERLVSRSGSGYLNLRLADKALLRFKRHWE